MSEDDRTRSWEPAEAGRRELEKHIEELHTHIRPREPGSEWHMSSAPDRETLEVVPGTPPTSTMAAGPSRGLRRAGERMGRMFFKYFWKPKGE